jgi:hypothetical protein
LWRFHQLLCRALQIVILFGRPPNLISWPHALVKREMVQG